MIPRFPLIRKRQHRHYTKQEIGPILSWMSENAPLPRGALSQISVDTGIPLQTLSDWYHKVTEPGNEDWFPQIRGHPNRRVFDEQVEGALHEHLMSNFVTPGVGATVQNLQTLALNAYGSLEPSQMHTQRFCASHSWASGFEKRWRLSLRTPHHERRTKVSEAATNAFLQRLNEIPNEYPLDLIFNMDETAWRLYLSPMKGLAEKGSESVKLCSAKGEKESFTAFGAISADGQKLPLWIIAKGKTDRSHLKFGEHAQVRIAHSINGWSTEELMLSYLLWIHENVAQRRPCVLVLDVYPSHRTDNVKECARQSGIELLFVPAGATGRLQPLDRRIFGELKSRARAEFNRLFAMNGERGADYQLSLQVLCDCWEQISGDNVRNAWVGIE
jgi:hypothetical protein